jgi:hypothetical protein
MSELVGREPGVSCAAAAQGIRRFGKWAPEHTEIHGFVKAILDQMSNRGSAAKPLLIKNTQLKTPPKGRGRSVKAAHIESWSVEISPSQVPRR